jgi:hypothetical protein
MSNRPCRLTAAGFLLYLLFYLGSAACLLCVCCLSVVFIVFDLLDRLPPHGTMRQAHCYLLRQAKRQQLYPSSTHRRWVLDPMLNPKEVS